MAGSSPAMTMVWAASIENGSSDEMGLWRRDPDGRALVVRAPAGDARLSRASCQLLAYRGRAVEILSPRLGVPAQPRGRDRRAAVVQDRGPRFRGQAVHDLWADAVGDRARACPACPVRPCGDRRAVR